MYVPRVRLSVQIGVHLFVIGTMHISDTQLFRSLMKRSLEVPHFWQLGIMLNTSVISMEVCLPYIQLTTDFYYIHLLK